MIRQEIVTEENMQLINNNQRLATWKKVSIISSSLLFSAIPGIGIIYLCNEKNF